MVFCNLIVLLFIRTEQLRHNPYFNRWFSAIVVHKKVNCNPIIVTILILIDGFLQLKFLGGKMKNHLLSQSLF